MFKDELRKKYKRLRAELPTEKIENMSIQIANQLLKIDIWDKLSFHLFLSIEELKEINTEYILKVLFAKDKEVVVSRSDFKTTQMSHYLLTENTRLKKNKYHIPEPIDGIEVPVSKIDVVFIPLLAFDKKGNRVGYGKGFYDKFMHHTNCIKIGLSFFAPEELIEDTNSHDLQLDYCITPKQIHRF